MANARIMTMSRTSFIISIFALILTIFGILAFIFVLYDRTVHISTLSGVGPLGGEVGIESGPYISVVPNSLAHKLTISNTGVGTLNAISGDIIINAAVGVDVITNVIGHTITVNNTGVLSLVTNDGIDQDSTAGDININHILTTQTLLPYGDPTGPQVEFRQITF